MACYSFSVAGLSGRERLWAWKPNIFKVIRKIFLKHNKSFRWHLRDYEKHIFSHLKACERRNFDFCVFVRMCSRSRCHWRACVALRVFVRSVYSAYITRGLTAILHIRKNTQKSKFLLSQAFKWEKLCFS